MLVTICVVVVTTLQDLPSASAQLTQEETIRVAEFKEKATKVGVGKRITVETINGQEVKGTLSEITLDSLLIADPQMTQQTSVKYTELKRLKGSRSKLFKTAIVAGVVLGIAAVACAAGGCHDN